MDIPRALDHVNALVYKPGWRISATDHTKRFEGAILVKVDYPAQNTNRDQAPEYAEGIMTYAVEPIMVGDCDALSLYRRVMEKIISIETHEAREYFRVEPAMDAPFHPHTREGMNAWGTPEEDLKFGIG